MRMLITILLMLLTLMPVACGTDIFGPAPATLRENGANGETLVLDELEAIARDPDLTEDQKRQRFQEMGIEDPDLIDALLELQELQ